MKPVRRVLTTKPNIPLFDSDLSEILSLIGHYVEARGGTAYVVGGYIRDRLLGIATSNVDLVVDGISPTDVARMMHRKAGFTSPVIFRRFGTVLAVGRGYEIEISRLKGDLKADATRRDFTINCLYVRIGMSSPRVGWERIVDPTGRGIVDLKQGLLTTPTDPIVTLIDDPVRAVRALRFHATLGFKVSRPVLEAIARMVYLVASRPPERMRQELEKIVTSKRLYSSLKLMAATNLLKVLLPELACTDGYDQAIPFHRYDLLTHLLKTASFVPADLPLRLAALLHDIGKPSTRSRRGTRTVYYGHDKVSAQLATSLLSRLRFPNKVLDEVEFLIRNHMLNYSDRWSDAAIRRLIKRCGPLLDKLLLLVEADRRAQAPGVHPYRLVSLRRRISDLKDEGADMISSPLDGFEIMEILGLSEGPKVGEAKNFLTSLVLKLGRKMSKEEARRHLIKWAIKHDLTRRL